MSSSQSVKPLPVWHPSLKGERRDFFKSVGPFFLVITIVLWICLPIFWGSTLLLEHYFYRLNIQVVDFDSAANGANAMVGPSVVQSLLQINQGSGAHVTYYNMPTSDFPNGPSDVMQSVGYNEAWGAVVIYPNATTAWLNAVQNGDSSYDPTGCVGIFYSGAHFYQVVLIYLVPILKSNVQSALSMASDAASRMFLQNAITAQNATALTTALAAPQSLGNVFGYFTFDTRPITAWASAGPMEAGLIYNTIFTFLLVLLSAVCRMKTGLQMKLTTASLIKTRLAVPAFAYIWFSLFYTLVVRAFQVPLDTAVGRAGFVVFWILNYFTFLAIGLALEAFISLVTIRWFPFTLIGWIILNITSSFLPVTLMQPFYHWAYAWPFRLNVEASKLLFFSTQRNSILGQYFGGLIAWSVAGVISVTLFQLLDRWRMDRGMKKQIEQKNKKNADENASHSSGDTVGSNH